MNIGKAIKFARVRAGLGQVELAKKIDVNSSYISLIERNKRSPSFSVVENIASALNMPLFLLVFLASEKNEVSAIDLSLIEKLSYEALK